MSSNRSVVVRLSAQVGDYVSNIARASQSTDDLTTAQQRAGRATDAAAQEAQQAAGPTRQLTAAQEEARRATEQDTQATEQNTNSTQENTRSNERAVPAADSLAAAADRNRDSWDKAGGALLAFGVGTLAALGASAKAAMDWESAWAGVTKTVEGSPEEMAALESGLRGLAKTLPITHTEIAGVAEAAGQLGVARKDVLGFTKTMVDLGVSTNLTAEDAATNIAQISNVMGTMAREGSLGVARFGSALVALGNDGASTEAEILAMAQRISGAGATVGATEVEVLALANTLASMGVQAELGGGVTTRVLLKMYSAVEEGGEKLSSFAAVAGTSASEFAKAFRESPVQAMDMVAQGLARVRDEGGNVVSTMADLGIKGTQETQVMLSLANSGTLLADSLALGATAWAENTALVEEATKRYDTADSKVKIAWNNIKDAAISAGAVMLPVIAGIADGVADLAGWFSNLPAPVQGALSVLGGTVGIIALLAGGFLTLFPRVMDIQRAFTTLNTTSPGLTSNLKKMGVALGIAGVALAAANALKNYSNSLEPAVATTEEMTQALISVSKNKNAINDVFANIDPGSGGNVLQDVNNIGDALDRITNGGFNDKMGQFGNDVLGINNDFHKMEEAITNVDGALAGFVGAGNFDQATEGFKQIVKSAAEQGIGLDELEKRFPKYIDSLRQAANTAGVHVEETDLMNWAMGETPQVMLDAAAATEEAEGKVADMAAAEEAAAAASEEFAEAMADLGLTTDGTIISLDKFTEALFASGLATMSSREAAFAWEETLRGVGAQIADVGNGVNATGTDFDKLTEAGQKANGVLQGLISEGLGVATTFGKDVSKSAADVNLQLQGTYKAGVNTAKGLGLGEEAAIALTRELMGIPPGVSIETWMNEQALAMAGQTGEAVRDIPDSVVIQTSMDEAAFKTAGKTRASAEDVPGQVTIDSWMADTAFIEAIRTRAAAEGIPPDVAVQSFMESAARNEADDTTSTILRIPKGASITSYMEEYARLEAERLKAAIDAIPPYKKVEVDYINTTHNRVINSQSDAHIAEGPGGRGGITKALGGRLLDDFGLNGLAGGGRVPGQRSANVTQDNTRAWAAGEQIALQGTEWVINPRSSDKYDDELNAINNGSFPKGLLSASVRGFGRDVSAPPAMSRASSGTTEKHYHTHVSPAPGLEQSYAQLIADKATERQRDIQLAYGID